MADQLEGNPLWQAAMAIDCPVCGSGPGVDCQQRHGRTCHPERVSTAKAGALERLLAQVDEASGGPA